MPAGPVAAFKLQHPGTCTGMFWRGDPRSSGSAPSGEWPRNGSILHGHVHKDVGGDDWLQVTEWSQAGKTSLSKAPGAWMPFHQGGLLLHAVGK